MGKDLSSPDVVRCLSYWMQDFLATKLWRVRPQSFSAGGRVRQSSVADKSAGAQTFVDILRAVMRSEASKMSTKVERIRIVEFVIIVALLSRSLWKEF